MRKELTLPPSKIAQRINKQTSRQPLDFAPEIDLRNFLQQDFEMRKKKNSRYSIRAYAKKIGLSHSALTQIMNGSRPLTKRSIKMISENLKLDPSLAKKMNESHQKDPIHFKQLKLESLQALSKWHCDSLLELFLVEDFKEDSAWMAARLGISQKECESALASLIEQGMIGRTKKGQLRILENQTTTVGLVAGADIINEMQIQLLQKQIEAIRQVPLEQRSSLGMTIAIDPADLVQARQIIFKFITELNQFLNRGKVRRKEVFRLNVGLFPLTKPLGAAGDQD